MTEEEIGVEQGRREVGGYRGRWTRTGVGLDAPQLSLARLAVPRYRARDRTAYPAARAACARSAFTCAACALRTFPCGSMAWGATYTS